MNKIIKNTLILTAITLISGLLLGMVYEITKDPIAASQEKARQEAYKAVLKEADSFADYADFDEKEAAKAVKDISGCTVNGVAEAKDKSGETIGYVVTTTSSEGYGGDIQISVGIGNDGVVEGVEILSISETAGLGMKATEAKFRDQYVGKLWKLSQLQNRCKLRRRNRCAQRSYNHFKCGDKRSKCRTCIF